MRDIKYRDLAFHTSVNACEAVLTRGRDVGLLRNEVFGYIGDGVAPLHIRFAQLG